MLQYKTINLFKQKYKTKGRRLNENLKENSQMKILKESMWKAQVTSEEQTKWEFFKETLTADNDKHLGKDNEGHLRVSGVGAELHEGRNTGGSWKQVTK